MADHAEGFELDGEGQLRIGLTLVDAQFGGLGEEMRDEGTGDYEKQGGVHREQDRMPEGVVRFLSFHSLTNLIICSQFGIFATDMSNKKFKRFINDNPTILRLMHLMGFKLGFGDMTVEEVCAANGVSPELFSTICDIYTQENPQIDMESLRTSDIPVLLSFLRTSHCDYIQNSFKMLHDGVHRMAEHCSAENSAIVNRFFDEYNKARNEAKGEETPAARFIGNDISAMIQNIKFVRANAKLTNAVYKNMEDKVVALTEYMTGRRDLPAGKRFTDVMRETV
jgi:regulator of cell morphogenesis and NO signaling